MFDLGLLTKDMVNTLFYFACTDSNGHLKFRIAKDIGICQWPNEVTDEGFFCILNQMLLLSLQSKYFYVACFKDQLKNLSEMISS